MSGDDGDDGDGCCRADAGAGAEADAFVGPAEREAGVAGVGAGRLGAPGGSDAWRWSTGISAAGWAVAGADGTTPAGPSGPAVLAPAGISRRGPPSAGRTTSAAGRPETRSGDGASPSGTARSGPLRRSDTDRWTAGAAAGPDGAADDEGAEAGEEAEEEAGAAGTSPAICRNGIAGRRATISGGAIRRGRTAAGVRAPDTTADRAGVDDPDASDVPGAPDGDRFASAGAAPRAAPDRWTGGGDPGLGFPVPVPPFVLLPLPVARVVTEVDGRSVAGPAGSSAPGGRTARSSSGPPGEADRAAPGRATPWMRPTGADGRTEWPSSPPRAGFCQEASRDRNRSPSLTPIEDRATVTDGGATRRQPPSQPPPSAPEAAEAPEPEPESEP
ncbi:hypothetical protein ACFWJY_35865 [Streptomyces anulatus]|uniref:hypothetical protein n=1 Tax=Streptomyces anulatus TaxID=1892 RepID=UPI0036625FC1